MLMWYLFHRPQIIYFPDLTFPTIPCYQFILHYYFNQMLSSLEGERGEGFSVGCQSFQKQHFVRNPL